MEGIGFGLALNSVRLHDAGGGGFSQRSTQFGQDILAQDLIIELSRSLAVEREPSHFADRLVTLGGVTVVLGTRRAELDNGIALPQFVFELAQVLTQGRTDLTGLLHKHHRICVKVQDPFSE